MRDWLILPVSAPAPLDMPDIAGIVATRFHLKRPQLLGEWRYRKFAWPRHIAIWLCTLTGRWSTPQIGRYFARDHTSIIYARDHVRHAIAVGDALGASAIALARELDLPVNSESFGVPDRTTMNALRGRRRRQYLRDASAMEGSV